MTYEQTISWLYSLEGKLGMDFRLERLGPVLDRLEHPETAFSAVHIAGTNGKGSTSAMVHSILAAAGHSVGLYTSPHLNRFEERIRVDQRMIERDAVVRHVAKIRRAATASGVELTYFEITTIAAFLEFRKAGVPLAVVEVGLGGRLDATNIVRSVAVGITSIGLDHCAFLGDTLEAVAREKAGIIKDGVPTVTGPLPPQALRVIEEAAARHDAPLLVCGRDFSVSPTDHVGLQGEHQRENAAVARTLVASLPERFRVMPAQIERGLGDVRWPGRLETIDSEPTVIVDGAHNPHAVGALISALDGVGAAAPRVLVFGVMADKDWQGMLRLLAEYVDHVVSVPVDQPRALDPKLSCDFLSSHCSASVADSVVQGLNEARARAGVSGSVVVTGSIFLVGEAYRACGLLPESVDAPAEP